MFDEHGDDPKFGYRFLADGAADAGLVIARRAAWRICSATGWFSVFSKDHRGTSTRPGPPVHDDLMGWNFTDAAPNGLWLVVVTEHRTLEGELYVCAIKDVFSNWIVGYSIDSRMRSRIAVNALNNAAAANTAMESFFALLQNNVLDRRIWSTREALRIVIVTSIERTCHRRRRQDALGRVSPCNSRPR